MLVRVLVISDLVYPFETVVRFFIRIEIATKWGIPAEMGFSSASLGVIIRCRFNSVIK